MSKGRKLTAVFCAAVMACCSFYYVSGNTNYNDVTYKEYNNLTENSDVPSLFKNDSVYNSYKDYPPVISDGVEYVPLELFYGLSGVKVSFSDDNSNFYIQNKKSNEYISFSVDNDYAVTGKNKVYETEVQTYYGVQYVPLRVVCENTGIGVSSYNDGENKNYAIKVYNTATPGLSAQELMEIHSPNTNPVPETEKKPNSGSEQKPEASVTEEKPKTEVPEKEEPKKEEPKKENTVTTVPSVSDTAETPKNEPQNNGNNTVQNTTENTTIPFFNNTSNYYPGSYNGNPEYTNDPYYDYIEDQSVYNTPIVTETPKAETPKVETPKAETPKVETPKVETPKAETPKVETPKVETPKAETPKVETPKVETPKAETPKVETPKQEKPKAETPKVETPKVEIPKVETPVTEPPKPELPKVEPLKPEAQIPTVTKPDKPQTPAPKQEEPVREVYMPGRIMLFYTPENFENVPATLYTLSGQGVKATFFVTEKNILMYPDLIRQIYIGGHTIGITFTESPDELYAPGALEEKIQSAENALYEVSKTKTRVVYLPEYDTSVFDVNDINARVDALGLRSVKFNGDSGTDYLESNKAAAKMAEMLKDIPSSFKSDTAYIGMSHTDSGNAVVGVIANLARAHSQLKLGLFDETTK